VVQDKLDNDRDVPGEPFPVLFWQPPNAPKGKHLITLAGVATGTALTPQQGGDGVFEILSPSPSGSDRLIPWIAANEDTGPLVKGLVDSPPGKNLIAYRENILPERAMETWAKVNSVKAQALAKTREQMIESMGEELGAEVWDTFAYIKEYGFAPKDDPDCVYPEDVSTVFAFGLVHG